MRRVRPGMNGEDEPRTALVTGASTGIGKAIAEGLAARGLRVVLACRDRTRGLQACLDVEARTGGRAELLEVDLARMGSVRAAADHALSRYPRIDVLVCNAAVWSTRRLETPEGVERTWATNVLGHHLLVRLLEERLARSAPSRVVIVASGLAHSLELDDVELRRRPYRGVVAYAQSKQANRMLSRAYARRLASRGIAVNAMHPGFTRTGAFARGGGWQGVVAGVGAALFGQSPARAADTAIWLATSDEVRDVSGGYFQDRNELPCPYVDEAAEDALHALCDRRTDFAAPRAEEALRCAS